MPSESTGFAVFDLETTGIYAGGNDRVIEFGVIRLDENLELIERWDTLINPERDIGDSNYHGITAGDVRDAPTFRQIAADIWHRFEGAIPVAHNLSFDRRFMVAEMERIGIDLVDFSGICTMNMASRKGISAGHRGLVDLCRHLGIHVREAHCAVNDAEMCCGVLNRLSKLVNLSASANPVSCNELWVQPASPLGITRHMARNRPIDSPLQVAAKRLNRNDVSRVASDASVDEYLLTLDKILEDRVVSNKEVSQLVLFVHDCGLSTDQAFEVHHKYFDALIGTVMSDGFVTESERRDLRRVGNIFGFDESMVNRLLEHMPLAKIPIEDLSGNTVCFTGTPRCYIGGSLIDKETAKELARQAGLIPKPRVTKALDILVVADPDTMSRKAETARRYGTRIIAEPAFWAKLGVE